MASTALASPALARDNSWYVEADGGVMIVEDTDLDINGVSDAASFDSDYGYDFGGLVGYDFGPFRLEAEGSYRRASFDEAIVTTAAGFPAGPGVVVGTGSGDATGHIGSLSFMVNGLLDFGPDDGIQGFVGGGAGVARTNVEASIYNVNGAPAGLDDSDTGFAWQALAGIRAPLTDNVDVGLKYRFYNAPNVDLIDRAGRDVETKMRSHSLLGTLTYNFGAPAAPPPPVAPPPPPVTPPPPPPAPTPPPPPPCNTGPYIVFFDWDKAEITPEAASVLNNAVSAYANCGSASVMLAGYTDTSGTKQYNQGLSERRNDSVRSYLSSRGIPDMRISSEGFGENDLRVPTADGVREPQNRRVRITYGPGSGM